MADPFDGLLLNVQQVRDERRPTMEAVVAVFDKIFARFALHTDFRQSDRGPLTWSWVDASNAHLGFEKWYVLSHSTMDGTEGYPLLTIRASVAPRLDAWLSVSQLVVGPSDQEIETSLT